MAPHLTPTRFEVDINAPRVREIVKQNAPIFKAAMDGLIEACQIPGATEEENVALVLRSAVAYASGVCKTFHVSPDQFKELMYLFNDARITDHRFNRVRIPKPPSAKPDLS